jgi:transmembrane sensor
MKEFLPEIDELIAKVLTDEATTEDKAELNQWLKESPTNQRYFDDLSRIWVDSTDAIAAEYDASEVAQTVNTDVAWRKVKQRVNQPKSLKVSWLRSNVFKMAAAIAFLIIAVFYFKNTTPPQYNYVADAKVTTDTLTDGSVITLNKKSTLTTVFSKNERRVRMTGEAFFAVAPDKEKPFVIEVKTVEVKVVGTAFNVDEVSQQGKIIIVVEEGIVEAKGKNDNIRLIKGNRAVYDLATNTFEKSENTDKNVVAYKTGKLEFEGAPLKNIVAQINKNYDKNIVIASPSIENCPVTTTYAGEDIEQWFKEIIKENINIEVEKQGDKLILRGQGCEQ